MFGEQLKNVRIASGYSQQQVADMLHISRQSLSKWENNRGTPDITILIELSKLYRVSVDELIREKEKVDKTLEPKPPVEAQIEEKITKGRLGMSSGSHTFDESLLLVLISVLASMYPFLGVAVSAWILVRIFRQKDKNYNKLLKLVIITCLLVNLLNVFVFFNNVFFHIGKATVV